MSPRPTPTFTHTHTHAHIHSHIHTNTHTSTQCKKENRKKETSYGLIHCTKILGTNAGTIFIKFISNYSPALNTLHKIFNKNTVKKSYSCTDNIAQIIKRHNTKITKNQLHKPNTSVTAEQSTDAYKTI